MEFVKNYESNVEYYTVIVPRVNPDEIGISLKINYFGETIMSADYMVEVGGKTWHGSALNCKSREIALARVKEQIEQRLTELGIAYNNVQ